MEDQPQELTARLQPIQYEHRDADLDTLVSLIYRSTTHYNTTMSSAVQSLADRTSTARDERDAAVAALRQVMKALEGNISYSTIGPERWGQVSDALSAADKVLAGGPVESPERRALCNLVTQLTRWHVQHPYDNGLLRAFHEAEAVLNG